MSELFLHASQPWICLQVRCRTFWCVTRRNRADAAGQEGSVGCVTWDLQDHPSKPPTMHPCSHVLSRRWPINCG